MDIQKALEALENKALEAIRDIFEEKEISHEEALRSLEMLSDEIATLKKVLKNNICGNL